MSSVPGIPGRQAEEIRRLAARHGVERVRVFGSAARGEQGPGSDLDLLIRLRPGHGFSDFMAFCEEAEAALGRHVDVEVLVDLRDLRVSVDRSCGERWRWSRSGPRRTARSCWRIATFAAS